MKFCFSFKLDDFNCGDLREKQKEVVEFEFNSLRFHRYTDLNGKNRQISVNVKVFEFALGSGLEYFFETFAGNRLKRKNIR